MPDRLQLNVGRAATSALATLAMAMSCGGSVAPPPPLGDIGANDAGVRVPDAASDSAIVVVCGDKQADVHNCGACGHDCRGDACVAGVCVSRACNPVALATGQQRVYGLAIDAASVYWTSNAGVSACPLDGCVGPPTILVPPNNEFHIAVGGPNLFWDSLSVVGILSCIADDCPRTISVFTPLGGGEFVTDATSLYFGRGGQSPSISKCRLAGCNGGPQVLTGSTDVPRGFVVMGPMFYFLDVTSHELRECSTDGCAAHERTLVGGLGDGYPLAVDDTNVYFERSYFVGSNNVIDILLCPRSGCTTPTVLVAGHPVTPSVALDARHLYWVEGVGATHLGNVQRCAISGCDGAPTVVASGQGWPYTIADDATSVYWGNNEGGQIMKCAK